MKIRVYLQDPDGFSEAVDEAVGDSVKALGLNPVEAALLAESRRETARAAMEKWVKYNEYVGITFDLVAGTATVDEVSR